MLAPGDRLREWWDGLSRVQKWGFGVLLFGVARAAAAVHAAVPGHPGYQLRRHHGAVRDGRDHRDRPQRRGRPGRPARPRLRRLLRRRRLHRRAAHQPGQPVEQARPDRVLQRTVGVAVVCAARDGLHRARRPDPGHADAAAARRLPGDRHAGIRRDHPADGRQPGRHHQRPARPQRGRVSRGWGRARSCPRACSPAGTPRATPTTAPGGSGWAHPDGRHPAAGRQPGAQPGRPRLGRHPRGRGRRGSDGRQHVPVQAVGVRDRRGDRRAVRRALRRPGAVRRAADLQHHQLDAVPVRGGARRAGQQAGRDLRRVHHRLPAEPAARRAVPRHQHGRPEVPVLRPGAGGDDDLPARRACSRPASNCWPTEKPRATCCASSPKRSRPHDIAHGSGTRDRSRNWPGSIARSTPPRAKSSCRQRI